MSRRSAIDRRDSNIGLFSMSALDLFASAMGAFVLLAVMMLPYYHKGKEMEEEIGQLEPRAAASAAQAAAAETRAEAAAAELAAMGEQPGIDLSPEARAIKAAETERQRLQRAIATVAGKIEATKAKAAAQPKPQPKPPANKVTFRFLGLKTDAERYLILVDGGGRIKDRAGNLPEILKDILTVMGPQKEYAIAFYRYVDGQLVYDRWPTSGFTKGGKASRGRAQDFLKRALAAMGGGSATLQALRWAVAEEPESIILVTDGFIYPPHNEGQPWQGIIQEVTRANQADVEINAVAVGVFNRNATFWTFLNELRKRNGGDLKAIPP